MHTITCPTCDAPCIILPGSSAGVRCPACGIVGHAPGGRFQANVPRAFVGALAVTAALCRAGLPVVARNPLAEAVGTAEVEKRIEAAVA